MTPKLISLGAAHRETRAVSRGDTMELNPLLYFEQTGVRAEVLPLGAAAGSTRAVDRGEQAELNPIFEWSPAGVRAE